MQEKKSKLEEGNNINNEKEKNKVNEEKKDGDKHFKNKDLDENYKEPMPSENKNKEINNNKEIIIEEKVDKENDKEEYMNNINLNENQILTEKKEINKACEYLEENLEKEKINIDEEQNNMKNQLINKKAEEYNVLKESTENKDSFEEEKNVNKNIVQIKEKINHSQNDNINDMNENLLKEKNEGKVSEIYEFIK